MRIISNFVDCYDFAIGVPQPDYRDAVYKRSSELFTCKLPPALKTQLPLAVKGFEFHTYSRIDNSCWNQLLNDGLISMNQDGSLLRDTNVYSSGYLVVCGRFFPSLVVNKPRPLRNSDHILSKRVHDMRVIVLGPKYVPWAYNPKYQNDNQTYRSTIEERIAEHRKRRKFTDTDFIVTLPPQLNIGIELSRFLNNSPVFYYSDSNTGSRGMEIYEAPLLASSLLIEIYKIQQIYQDIDYFVTNIVRESPDVQPAGKPPQTDVEKLESHGFDKQQSFRHRK